MLMGVGESEEEDKGKEVVDSVLRVLGVEKGDVEYIGRVERIGRVLTCPIRGLLELRLRIQMLGDCCSFEPHV